MTRPWTVPTTIALGVAAAYSLLLVVLATVVPVYGTESSTTTLQPDGSETVEVSSGGATLVSVNGLTALLPVAVPLVVTLLVAVLLRRSAGRPAYATAWVLVALYGAFCVLALLSIGIFLMPVALVLLVACACARLGTAPAVATA